MIDKIKINPIKYENGKLIILDQRELPQNEKYETLNRLSDVTFAIKEMMIRGAPAIGLTAAYGYIIGIKEGLPEEKIFNTLLSTRPTAVNLYNALLLMREEWKKWRSKQPDILIPKLEEVANELFEKERKRELSMGEIGNGILPQQPNVITHCNTGALATTGWGTALGVIRTAFYSGKDIFVWVDETRPRLQGARLTAWELVKEGIPHKIIADNAASFVMKKFKIDAIFVGADRVALNGDTANKIGTYQLAISAKYHKVPLYVVAPTSTIDSEIENGKEIIIEERGEEEIKKVGNCPIAPEESEVFNPAFDVTPAELISGGIITEKGLSRYPFEELREWTQKS